METPLTKTSSPQEQAPAQNATTPSLRQRMRQFYETSQAYKALLDAHDEVYHQHYVELVTKALPPLDAKNAKRQNASLTQDATDSIEKQPQPARKILDLGCGNGISARLIHQAGHDVTGTDISPLFLEDARKWENPHLRYQVCDAHQLPFEAETFDVVCSNELIEHLPDVETALAQMIRVVRKGGRIVLSGPNLSSPLTPLLDCLRLLVRKQGRRVWAETKTQALQQLAKNSHLYFKKQFSKQPPQFIYRNPDLQTDAMGGDADSAYYTSPIDLVQFFRLNGCTIVKKCVGFGLKGSIIAKTVPYLSPYISMVVEK